MLRSINPNEMQEQNLNKMNGSSESTGVDDSKQRDASASSEKISAGILITLSSYRKGLVKIGSNTPL